MEKAVKVPPSPQSSRSTNSPGIFRSSSILPVEITSLATRSFPKTRRESSSLTASPRSLRRDAVSPHKELSNQLEVASVLEDEVITRVSGGHAAFRDDCDRESSFKYSTVLTIVSELVDRACNQSQKPAMFYQNFVSLAAEGTSKLISSCSADDTVSTMPLSEISNQHPGSEDEISGRTQGAPSTEIYQDIARATNDNDFTGFSSRSPELSADNLTQDGYLYLQENSNHHHLRGHPNYSTIVYRNGHAAPERVRIDSANVVLRESKHPDSDALEPILHCQESSCVDVWCQRWRIRRLQNSDWNRKWSIAIFVVILVQLLFFLFIWRSENPFSRSFN